MFCSLLCYFSMRQVHLNLLSFLGWCVWECIRVHLCPFQFPRHLYHFVSWRCIACHVCVVTSEGDETGVIATPCPPLFASSITKHNFLGGFRSSLCISHHYLFLYCNFILMVDFPPFILCVEMELKRKKSMVHGIYYVYILVFLYTYWDASLCKT